MTQSRRGTKKIVSTDQLTDTPPLNSTQFNPQSHQNRISANAVDNPKPRQKKRKKTDSAYSVKQDRTKKTKTPQSNDFLLRMRTNTDVTIKTSVLIDDTLLAENGYQQSDMKSFLAEGSLPVTHRPGEVIAVSINGSPEKMVTPGKTLLHRDKKISKFHFFSNAPDNIPLSELSHQSQINLSALKTSSAYQAVKKTALAVKKTEIQITQTQLLKTQKENSLTNKRHVSQNKVMAADKQKASLASATQLINDSGLFSHEIKAEWLHLIAHQVLGKMSQHHDNLVAGLKHTNTDQLIFPESMTRTLAHAFNEDQGFLMKTDAELFLGTQIAKKIVTQFKTDFFTLEHEFDAQNPNQSHFSYHLYYKQLIEVLINVKKDLSQTPKIAPSVTISTVEKHPGFFNKKTLKEKVVQTNRRLKFD